MFPIPEILQGSTEGVAVTLASLSLSTYPALHGPCPLCSVPVPAPVLKSRSAISQPWTALCHSLHVLVLYLFENKFLYHHNELLGEEEINVHYWSVNLNQKQ